MAHVLPLDAVIKKVDNTKIKLEDGQKLVIVDEDKQKVAKKGLTAFLNNNRVPYVVSNSSNPMNSVEHQGLQCSVRFFEENRVIKLLVKYLTCCLPGNEEKVAVALSGGVHPGANLDQLIIGWVNEFARNHAGFVENPLKLFSDLNGYLKDNTKKHVGLTLDARCSLDGMGEMMPWPIAEFPFLVTLPEGGREVGVRMKTELGVHKEYQMNAFQSQAALPSLKDKLVAWVGEEVLESGLDIGGFSNAVISGAFKTELEGKLNIKLRMYGRKLNYLLFELEQDISKEKTFYDFSHTVNYKIDNFPTPIMVENRFQLEVKDFGMFMAAGVLDLEAWTMNVLSYVVPGILFEIQYIDLLLRFTELEREIKNKTADQLNTIGCSVKHHVIVPNLAPLDLLKPFTVEARDQFRTKFPNFSVELEVVVTAKIRELSSVQEYLNRQQDVKTEISKTIVSVIRDFLHSIDPERFFMRFYYTDPATKELPVEQEIKGKIIAALGDDFGADVIQVVPKMMATDITERLNRLQAGACHFEFQVGSLFDQGEQVTFTGDFLVQGVDSNGWPRVVSQQKYEISDVRDQLVNHLKGLLEIFPTGDLKYQNLNQLQGIAYLIDNKAKQYIQDEFGLCISTNNIYRGKTKVEEALSNAKANSAIAEIGHEENKAKAIGLISSGELRKIQSIVSNEEANLNLLLGQLSEALTVGDEEAVEEIKNKIDAVRNGLGEIDRKPQGMVATAPDVQPTRLMDHLRSLVNNQMIQGIGSDDQLSTTKGEWSSEK